MKYTISELSKKISISETSLTTNFPLVCSKMLKKGIKIIKEGKGKNALYSIVEVEPCQIDKQDLSTVKKRTVEEMEGEEWRECPSYHNYEVSNYGRFRNKISKIIYNGTKTKQGYINVSAGYGNVLALHRLVLQAFNPIPNPQDFTVEHLNGIRSDNRIENLKWVSNTENIGLMLMHRADLNQELTRLIQNHGYEKTLALLKSLN